MPENIYTIDVETTISNKGNPFDLTNKLVMVGVKLLDSHPITYETNNQFDKETRDELTYTISRSTLLIGFNIKFDLHWLRRYGVSLEGINVWDCQLAEFLLSHQKRPYPSLDSVSEWYGLGQKIDNIELNYWDKGIDTDQIPKNELSDYLMQDLNLTELIYQEQRELLSSQGLLPLFKLQCQDLLVLAEMEYNGILFNTEKALTKASTIESELKEIVNEIETFTNGVPFNPASNDHVSALLYGGTIIEEIRVPIGRYATGEKKGQIRNKILKKEYILPRLVEPLKGSETAKEGFWKVNETVLRSLKPNGKARLLMALLNKFATLDKLRGTYLVGYSNLIKEMNWEKDMIHGTLNQCVAKTGRLSSTKPNLQNADPTTKIFMETRY
jgi:DNA polymerase I-like protein with 3'-5' exonuclease and polymerase domains